MDKYWFAGIAAGITAALTLIAYVGFVGGLVDFFFPPQAEVADSSSLVGGPAAVPQSAYIAAHTQLAHPLGYDAKVRDCLPSGRHCTDYRYYFAKGSQ